MKYEIRGTKYGFELYNVPSTKYKVGIRVVPSTKYKVEIRIRTIILLSRITILDTCPPRRVMSNAELRLKNVEVLIRGTNESRISTNKVLILDTRY